MSDFEFVFSLYGLLLGLSLAELLGGLARTIERRLRPGGAFRIGWLTPLLAIFVLLDLLSFWSAAWFVRGSIAVTGETLMFVTLFAGVYYLAAHLVFPGDADGTPDLDQHFFRVRRIVLGAMLVLLAAQILFYLVTPALAPALYRPLAVALTIVLALLIGAAMMVRGPGAARIVMLLLIARYVVVYLL
ncbi:hypothetical protein ACNI3Q_04545 [Sphingomonas sp. FW199]|uniref:hypothetical protein n=1 Tax=Sphingomonas sp. FW199 TaxID=3400217 RepID=UPI003CF74541